MYNVVTIIEKIGVKKDKYIQLNNRKILNGILETSGIGNINDVISTLVKVIWFLDQLTKLTG